MGDEDVEEIPDYVCCVLTEGVWTIFSAATLIIVLFTIATLKYFKKYLARSRFHRRNKKLMSRFATEDGKNAAALIRYEPIPVSQFTKYCNLRRQKHGKDCCGQKNLFLDAIWLALLEKVHTACSFPCPKPRNIVVS